MKGSFALLSFLMLNLLPIAASSEEKDLSLIADRAYASWQCAHFAQRSATKREMFEPLFRQGSALFTEVISDPAFPEFMEENPEHNPLRVLMGKVRDQTVQFKIGYLWAVTIDVTNLQLESTNPTDTDEDRERRGKLLAEQNFLKANCSLIVL